MSVLPRERYTVRDIYIDRDGIWHERGLRTKPANVLPTLDVAVIALHGEYGEDGEIQKLLEQFGVPYTGSDSFTSFEAMHKVIAKERARAAGLNVARYKFIEREEDVESAVHEIIRTYPQPVMVKPPRWGSSVGITAPAGYQPVHQAVTGLLAEGAGGALVEEFIRGTEASVTVVENLRGEELYALPPVEIVVPDSEPFLTYNAKYSGQTQELAPGRFSKAVAAELEDLARRMHTELRLRHYSRTDFIVSPKGIFYLETNTLPGLTAQSLTPKALASVGIAFSDFIEHIIALALGRRKR
jgi:D-alanine-D-alanine ligase